MEKSPAILTPNPLLPCNVIRIDPEKCIACYHCSDICRCNVIVHNPIAGQPPLVAYPDECWQCAVCTADCPTGAITFEHPTCHKITWKRKETGELYRVGMKNPPAPAGHRAYGDRTVYLQKDQTMNLVVSDIKQLARYVIYIKLEKKEIAIPSYRAGSFCNIRINEEIHRCYSFGNYNNGKYIELYIDTFGKGPGVTYLSSLKIGNIVEVSLPFGRMMYTPKSTNLLLIGSVTGIAPIKAILEQELFKEKSGRSIKLLFQVYDKEDVFLVDYLNELEKKYPNFTYKIFFLKQNSAENEPKLLEYIKETDFIDYYTDAYICASKALIKTIETELYAKDVFWGNIHYESFQQ